jgi:ethanolamine ammonia-lyase large subunit
VREEYIKAELELLETVVNVLDKFVDCVLKYDIEVSKCLVIHVSGIDMIISNVKSLIKILKDELYGDNE